MATPLENVDHELTRLAEQWAAAVAREDRAAETALMAALNRLLDQRHGFTEGTAWGSSPTQ